MPKSLLIANWKMNKTHDEARQFVRALATEVLPVQMLTVLCPAFTALPATGGALAEWSGPSRPALGAQNCAAAPSGAFTGEVAAPMLAALDCAYVLLGHSERRALFAETDELIASKVEQAWEHRLRVVLCIGETQEERDMGQTMTTLSRQLRSALPVEQPEAEKLIVAYEPVWAIGTGRTAQSEQISEVMLFLRDELKDLYGEEYAGGISLLYGGSVNASNIALLAACSADGALVGGASLEPKSFAELARGFAAARGLR